MKIIAISDLHGYLPELNSCDVVCICGDISPIKYDRDHTLVDKWFKEVFISWVDKLVCKKVIFIAGNHDFFLPIDSKDAYIYINNCIKEYSKTDKLIYLCDESYIFEDYIFYGTPWVSGLPKFHFNMDNLDKLRTIFKCIPNNISVLLTHSAPTNINDVGRIDYLQGSPIDLGNKELSFYIQNQKPLLTLCGHIHSGNHTLSKTLYGKYIVNCSLLNESYKVYYTPTEINIENNDIRV